jgi:putative protease
MNITNSYALKMFENSDCVTLSTELTLNEIAEIKKPCDTEIIVYGRIPLMLTERCFISENFGCDKCGRVSLVDRKGEKFPIIREQSHRNIIFNSLPTYMGDREDELYGYRIAARHLIFSTESAREIVNLLSALDEGASLPTRVRRIGRR